MLSKQIKEAVLVPYALRRVPDLGQSQLVPPPTRPTSGDIVLVRVEKIGKNTRLELVGGRMATLHEGLPFAAVFGNRYATDEFEGYGRCDAEMCDLLSQGGLCGLVASKHASSPEASRLRILGSLADARKRPVHLRNFALTPRESFSMPRVVIVCGTSMDSGKTYTAMSLIMGLRRTGQRVASIKLTGTAAGRDTWQMVDAGASPALDFVDGGMPSTYLSSTKELIDLYHLLLGQASSQGAEWVVIEIADGLLQVETAALLQTPSFVASVHSWVFAADSSMAAVGGLAQLRRWGIEPAALSGRVSMSPLASREAVTATGLCCITAKELQFGELNE